MSAGGDSYEVLLERALAGYREIASKTEPELKSWLRSQRIFPPNIAVGRGMSFISEAGLSAIYDYGRLWYANHKAWHAKVSEKKVTEEAANAFGALLSQRERFTKSDLSAELKSRLSSLIRAEHFYFAARVFEQPDVSAISVGPVQFNRRAEWLTLVEQIAGRSLDWIPEVRAAWEIELSMWEKFRIWLHGKILSKRRKHSRDKDVLSFAGTSDWIASVHIEGRERSRALECATTAVLVALDGIGLQLARKQAGNLRGPRDELNRQMHKSLSQFDGQDLNLGTSIDLPYVGGRAGDQASYLESTRNLRHAIGTAISAYIEVLPRSVAANVKKRWVEAMYWFGQSRRERNEFIAVVKIGIALDVLTKGAKATGITVLCSRLFNMKPEEEIFTGLQLGGFIAKLYNDGRSQIAHGGRLALLQELPVSVEQADSFAREVLTRYVACAEKYSGPDEYEPFLAAIPGIYRLIAGPPN